MTATTVLTPARRARAHGIDLLVMRMSMAALRWARRRADRAVPGRDEVLRLRAQHSDIARREHESALRAARVI